MRHKVSKMVFSTLLLLSFAFIIGCAGMDIETAEKSQYYYVPERLQEANRLLNLAREDGKDKACKKEFKAAEADVNRAFATYDECKADEAAAMIEKAIEKINALCPYIPPPPVIIPVPEVVVPPIPEVIVVPEEKVVPVEKVIDKLTLHINFDFDKAIIRKVEYPKLEKALEFISKYPDAALVIEGHTDSVGTEAYNERLSSQRANAVKEYFVTKGKINDARIKRVTGFGELKPIASNKTKEGRFENRRVEILIVSE
ncbi:MAG: OmpA family protein [Nitrospirae bacterium]|nr:OmpA family protein [Nitrospirota bacterium]